MSRTIRSQSNTKINRDPKPRLSTKGEQAVRNKLRHGIDPIFESDRQLIEEGESVFRQIFDQVEYQS